MNKFKTLTDHVYDYIAEQILLGKIAPGEKVNENIICEKLSVSRTPVREALIELSCDGILENVPRKGFLVRTLTLKNLKEIYYVTGILEGEAAKLSCAKLEPQDLNDMRFYIDSMFLAIEQGNYNMYHKQQDIFHHTFIDKCGNETLIDTLAHLKNQLLKRSYDEDVNPDIKKILTDTNKEHEKIYELFLARDAEQVCLYLRDVHWRPFLAEFEVI